MPWKLIYWALDPPKLRRIHSLAVKTLHSGIHSTPTSRIYMLLSLAMVSLEYFSPVLHANRSGNLDHGNEWCAREPTKDVIFCFDKHSGYAVIREEKSISDNRYFQAMEDIPVMDGVMVCETSCSRRPTRKMEWKLGSGWRLVIREPELRSIMNTEDDIYHADGVVKCANSNLVRLV